MKQWIVVVLSVICLTVPGLARAEEGWEITHFDSQLAIQADGEVNVTETIALDFHNIDKHGIYRDLPVAYQAADGSRVYTQIDITAVKRNGAFEHFEIIRNNSNVRIKIGDPDRTLIALQTYTIQYTARGVLAAYDAYDELYWNVTGNQWGVPIEKTTVTVTVPGAEIMQTACYQGRYGGAAQCSVKNDGDNRATFSAGRLESNEGVTIAAGFTPGIIPIITIDAPPTLAEQIKWTPLLLAFVVITGIGSWLIYRLWHRQGRDEWFGHHANPDDTARAMKRGDKEVITPEFAVPSNLRPAEIGLLVDERADTLDISATIVDLAVRGYLTITEEKKRGLFGGKDYLLTQKKKATTDLLDYEKKLYTALLGTGTSVRLSDLKNNFYHDLAAVKTALYKDAVKKQFFKKDPAAVRLRYYIVGFLLLALSVMLVFFSLSVHAWDNSFLALILGACVGLGVVSLLMIGTAHAMPARTATGRHLYRQALGYKLFVGNVEKYRAPFMEKANMFEQVLPYAMIFGVTHQLANSMKVLGVKPSQPTWYHGIHPFHPVVFANDVNSFTTSLSQTMASSPSSSGSGGGGFSGGGFGGGGGGSW